MKNRILSFVLALVMVLALVPVAAIGSSAEEAKEITISAGQVTVAPGETALVPLYVELSTTLGYQGISNFQIGFDLSEGAAITTGSEFFVTAGSAYGTANAAEKFVANSAESAAEGFIATASAVTAKGGALVALVAIAVDSTVAEGTVLTVAPNVLTDLQLCTYDNGKASAETKNEGYTVEFAAGSITVATVETTSAPSLDDDADYYEIPSYIDGKKVTEIGDDCDLNYTVGTMYVPAGIGYVSEDAIGDLEITDSLILKNPYAFEGANDLRKALEKNGTVYYHVLANGTGTIYDAVYNKNYNYVNILGGGAVVTGNDVTVYGSIRVNDLAYEDVTVEVIMGGKTFTADFTSVYTTLTHNGKAVVSNNDAAVELGAADGEGVYLFGLTITGVPAGEYDVVVNIYGTTAAANGSPVVVCNDATTVKVTV